jgi:hypothetical protein
MTRKRSRVDVDYLFVPAPHDLIGDTRVCHAAYRLWCLLHILAWRHEAPDPERLQALMEAGERSIYRWLKELEDAGWLTWHRNTYDLKNRFLLRTSGPGADTATLAQIRAALDGAASIEDIKRIVESADSITDSAPPGDETFANSGKSDPGGKSDPVGKSATRIKSSATRIRKSATSGKSSLDSSLADAANRPPSEDQNHENHDDDDGAALVRKLVERDMSETAAREIAAKGLDPKTILISVDNLLAAGKDMGHIVTRLRLAPPSKGHPYERLSRSGSGGDGPHGPGRSDRRQDRQRADGRNTPARPRPGELAYHERYLDSPDGPADGE